MMEREINGIHGRRRRYPALSSIDRYDVLLAVIPLAFSVALAVAETVGVPLEVALAGASVVGVVVVVDALFLRPPTSGLVRT